MHQKQTPILLITGYLGSGKTTLLNRILNNRRGTRFAVIVNDLGEVNIDADLIGRGGIVGMDDASLVPLQNGCICCSLQEDLIRQVADLVATDRFDYIVIEASGVCEPEPIAQTLSAMAELNIPGADVRLDCITTVVDALRLRDEFDSGHSLQAPGIDDDDIEALVIRQIEFCNMILLNKISEVTPEEAEMIRATIRAIQPTAKIIDCDFCNVNFGKLLDTHLFDFDKTATSATWIKEIDKPVDEEEEERHHHHHHDDDDDEHDDDEHEHDGHEHHHHHHHHHHHDGEEESHDEYGISTFVYFTRRPFSLDRFDFFCDRHWPAEIVRAKGLCYFEENPDMSYLFEQAGRQKRITQAGQWYATAPEEDLKMLLRHNPDLMRDWDPVVGDRMNKIVIIGRHLDRDKITRELDTCLAPEK
ncbi:MAG: GTP-binding protein [Pseudoflavonifractor sp.]|nr:GTP-binding protein [Alloprevotella sp.]MCM1116791.1 GTP-binding protein [Pseudoflavonifractor sp.]